MALVDVLSMSNFVPITKQRLCWPFFWMPVKDLDSHHV